MAASRLDLATICALALLAAAAWLVPGPPLLAKQTGETVRARVVSVDNSGLSDVGLLKYGSQTLKAEVLEGRFKGETFECANEVRARRERMMRTTREGISGLRSSAKRADSTDGSG